MPLQIVNKSDFYDEVDIELSEGELQQHFGWEEHSLKAMDVLYPKLLQEAINNQAESIALPILRGIAEQPSWKLTLTVAIETIRNFLNGCPQELQVYLVADKEFSLTETLYPELEALLAERLLREEECLDYCCNAMVLEMACSQVESDCNKMLSRVELEELIKHKPLTFSQQLLKLLDEKGLKDVEFYKRANIDRKLFSKLRAKDYKPSRNTVLAAIVGLKLEPVEAGKLMAAAGYAWNESATTDIIVRYFLRNKIYDIDRINLVLYEYGERTLGGRAG